MPTLATSDVTRAMHAIRRHWWFVVIAAVLGGLLGGLWTMSGRPVRYTAVVTMLPVQGFDALSSGKVSIQPQLADIVSTLSSDETRAALGDVVKDSTFTATPDESASTITLVVTAANDAASKSATTAFAGEAARLYRERGDATIAHALQSVTAGITSLRDAPTADATGAVQAKLAELLVRKTMLEKLVERPQAAVKVLKLASSETPISAVVTLALLFGGIGAALVGLRGLYDRTVRYRDDVEHVVGTDSFLAHVRTPADLPTVRAMLDRLADGHGIQVEVVGPKSPDLSMLGLSGEPGPDAPRLLLVELGTDTRAALDLAHRVARAGDTSFLGALAVDPGTGVLSQGAPAGAH